METFKLNILRWYRGGNESNRSMSSMESDRTLPPIGIINHSHQCCCTIEELVKQNNEQPMVEAEGSNHLGMEGFVQSERRLQYNMLLLSLTSSIALGVVYTLISLDRYFYGRWTFLTLSAAFLFGALSVYYAQACVTRFGPNRVLGLATCAIIFYVLVHFSSNLILYQLGLIILAIWFGPFYAAQLEFIGYFSSRLIHLTKSIKRRHEERSHRLLHLLLFCPSHIVGHLIFVIIAALYGQTSSMNDNKNERIQRVHYHHQSIPQHIGTMKYSGATTTEWSDEWQSMTPSCLHQFQQQVCDHALYYIFSFNRYQMSTNTDPSTNHIKPFTINFTILLLSIFLLVVVSALIIVLLLLHRTEHLQVQDPLERGFLSSSIRNVLFRTFHDHHLRLLLPMAFFVGLEQGFFIADFNKLYVSCALGFDAIGLVMLTRGCVHLGATLLVHEFVRHIHRPLILLSGAICQLGVLAILCLWRPNDDLPLYYVITACWALSNAIWETLLLTNILRTFCSEEWNYALLTVYSFISLGLSASFGISEFVCLYIKLYGMMAALVIAIIPMKVCELRLLRLEKILGPGSASQV
ncbi:hypothetical protein RDWZM_007530 [Blomia tropicalis]|uniref:Uncharacterized protein n=1 Tax=Blomia tropicalis TaxID=40697 RepID=A0A9Q0M0D3_BLOTA|nr:hypothetical protein RDWZM_007530 [Blomia tropicalis]